MQHDEIVSLKMRNHSYTERITYFNSFKKSNNTTYVDKKFPPHIKSLLPNYKGKTGLFREAWKLGGEVQEWVSFRWSCDVRNATRRGKHGDAPVLRRRR